MDGFEIEIVRGGRGHGKMQAFCEALKEYANGLNATPQKPLKVAVFRKEIKKDLEERLFLLGANNVLIDVIKPREYKSSPRDFFIDYWRGGAWTKKS